MTDLKSEYDSCLVCEGNEWTTVREEEDLYRPEYQKKFRLTCCRCCGLVMQNPKPGKEELGVRHGPHHAMAQTMAMVAILSVGRAVIGAHDTESRPALPERPGQEWEL